LAIVLSVVGHKKKARKLKDLENKQRIAEAEAQQAIAQANSSLDAYKRQQEMNRAADKEHAEQERLATLMKTKNIYPRLVCELEGVKSQYDMTKPTVTIGREQGNDLVFNHASVSRQHAIIAYDGYGFYIIDTNSTNHVLVNGQLQTQIALHSADTIQLGQVKIIYYL
jgi:acyl-CoA reductase-like NAD-dependent aldehyde dehydrogenase